MQSTGNTPTSLALSAPVPLESAAAAFLPNGDALYLDCAAQGPRLQSVHAAGLAAFEAVPWPWMRTPPTVSEQREQLRALLARLFDGDENAVALVPSAAHGLAAAANSLPLDAGDTVLVLDGQFPSNLMCWQQRCADTGARLSGVRREAGQNWTGAVLDAIAAEPRLRIAALPQVRWDVGATLDLDRICVALQARGAFLVLDLSQSLGVLVPELARWRPDFVVSVGFKWLLGARGQACLWAAPRWREHGRPIEHHWCARNPGPDWRFPLHLDIPWASGARRFDAGGLDDPVRLAMAIAGLEQVLAWGPTAIANALGERTRCLEDALDHAGLGAWIVRNHASHIMALQPPAEILSTAQQALREANIICTCRHGRLRIAPHLHVFANDMLRVADALAPFAS